MSANNLFSTFGNCWLDEERELEESDLWLTSSILIERSFDGLEFI